jgi:hypothetical protein
LQMSGAPRRTSIVRHLTQAPGKGKKHGEHGATLDHDIKKFAWLSFQFQPVLCQQQVTRGGDRKEFGDAFDQAQQDDSDVRHGAFRG